MVTWEQGRSSSPTVYSPLGHMPGLEIITYILEEGSHAEKGKIPLGLPVMI